MKLAFWKQPAPKSIGKILVDRGFLTRIQLQRAIEVKMRSSGEALLGEVLIAQGLVTRHQLDQALDEQRQRQGTGYEFAARAKNLTARSTAQIENLHGSLDGVESAAKELTARMLQSEDDEEKMR